MCLIWPIRPGHKTRSRHKKRRILQDLPAGAFRCPSWPFCLTSWASIRLASGARVRARVAMEPAGMSQSRPTPGPPGSARPWVRSVPSLPSRPSRPSQPGPSHAPGECRQSEPHEALNNTNRTSTELGCSCSCLEALHLRFLTFRFFFRVSQVQCLPQRQSQRTFPQSAQSPAIPIWSTEARRRIQSI